MIGAFTRRRRRPEEAQTLRALEAVMESAASPLVRASTRPDGSIEAFIVEIGPIARRQRRTITRDIAELARPIPVRTVREHKGAGIGLVAARERFNAGRREREADDPFFADLDHFVAACTPQPGNEGV